MQYLRWFIAHALEIELLDARQPGNLCGDVREILKIVKRLCLEFPQPIFAFPLGLAGAEYDPLDSDGCTELVMQDLETRIATLPDGTLIDALDVHQIHDLGFYGHAVPREVFYITGQQVKQAWPAARDWLPLVIPLALARRLQLEPSMN